MNGMILLVCSPAVCKPHHAGWHNLYRLSINARIMHYLPMDLHYNNYTLLEISVDVWFMYDNHLLWTFYGAYVPFEKPWWEKINVFNTFICMCCMDASSGFNKCQTAHVIPEACHELQLSSINWSMLIDAKKYLPESSYYDKFLDMDEYTLCGSICLSEVGIKQFYIILLL